MKRLSELRAQRQELSDEKKAKLAALELPVDPEHHCHAAHCSTPVKPELLMCAKHWRMVSKRVQRLVWKYYRVGQCDDKSPSIEWIEAARQAVIEVADKEYKKDPDNYMYPMFYVEPVIDYELE